MKKELPLFPLLDKFISESRRGKRLQKNGTRIKSGTIRNYTIVRQTLKQFSDHEEFELRVSVSHRFRRREYKSEQIYWKRFYLKFTEYLYDQGCFDNYVGTHIKIIRCFFNYLNRDKGLSVGDFHKSFYPRSETIPIVVLSPEQLQFLIYNNEFETILPVHLRRTKDIFVFGSSVGLRFSDLMHLTKKNLQQSGDAVYLAVRSQKTSKDTRIKLPEYTMDIIRKYKNLKSLLPQISDARLNHNLKELCERAGWTQEVDKTRERRGAVKKISNDGKQYRFCDLVTTHTMRRTAITTLLSLGVPEIMVRKISGHAANSKEFYRYVDFAQQHMDNETDKAFERLSNISI